MSRHSLFKVLPFKKTRARETERERKYPFIPLPKHRTDRATVQTMGGLCNLWAEGFLSFGSAVLIARLNVSGEAPESS